MQMAQVVVVTSGKGGVGKTTSTAALGAALARAGERVVVVDFDVGLRNLDLVMGAERRVVFDLIHVVQGTARLSQALIRDKRIDTLFLLAASQTRDKDSLSDEGVERVIRELRPSFDWVICDSPTSPWWWPIRRCLRSAIPIELSACSTRLRTRPNAASQWRSICF
jgi:septum site-determining protein MinD